MYCFETQARHCFLTVSFRIAERGEYRWGACRCGLTAMLMLRGGEDISNVGVSLLAQLAEWKKDG